MAKGDDSDRDNSGGKTETRDRETGVRTEIKTKQDETRTEVRLSETERIRTRTKDGETRVDITSGGVKTRLEASGIKVSTTSGEKFVVQKGTTGAVTEFPLSIDLATNTLSVNTPAGQKNVAVLPDQAVRNLLLANVINRLGGQAIVEEAREGSLSNLDQVITLGERNGVPVYEIQGISSQKLLGFIPISLNRTVEVSAETGNVVSMQESLLNRALDLISF